MQPTALVTHRALAVATVEGAFDVTLIGLDHTDFPWRDEWLEDQHKRVDAFGAIQAERCDRAPHTRFPDAFPRHSKSCRRGRLWRACYLSNWPSQGWYDHRPLLFLPIVMTRALRVTVVTGVIYLRTHWKTFRIYLLYLFTYSITCSASISGTTAPPTYGLWKPTLWGLEHQATFRKTRATRCHQGRGRATTPSTLALVR